MSQFKFIKDDQQLNFSTKTVQVEKQITIRVKQSLWNDVGNLKSIADLNAIGVQLKYIPSQTEERLMYEKCVFMYQAVPQLASRVIQFKQKYDNLGINYNAKTEDVEQALNNRYTDIVQKTTALAQFNAAKLNVQINFQAANRAFYTSNGTNVDYVDDFIVWLQFPILVKWLSDTYSQQEIPVRLQEEIITSDQRYNQVK